MPKLSAGHVLLVEDDHDTRNFFLVMLTQHGYQVDAVDDGHKALALLHSDLHVDVLVTDYQLPGCNGDELICKVHESTKRIPAILMSAHPDVIQLASRCGADAAFLKTDTISKLLVIVASLCAGTNSKKVWH